ncbi:MAG: PIN domain-containing protein [Chloroflexota bacterium]
MLDTNTISDILRRRSVALAHYRDALSHPSKLLMCPMVYHELYRGLLHRGARKQLAFLQRLIELFTWEEFTRDDWTMAAKVWANLRAKGVQIGDADLLIGIYAKRRQAILVTDNIKDFTPLGLTIENWRE